MPTDEETIRELRRDLANSQLELEQACDEITALTRDRMRLETENAYLKGRRKPIFAKGE